MIKTNLKIAADFLVKDIGPVKINARFFRGFDKHFQHGHI
jgi:hypothetical protein